jgi:hemolysin III
MMLMGRMQMSAEEIANSLSHGLGLALSLAGLVVLIVVAALHGSVLSIVSCSVYGATLVCLYAASTVYHAVWAPRWKRVLKIVDHSCIYLLIAGTYTPFALVALRGGWGWTLFGVVWALAFGGIIFKLWFVDRYPIASTIFYLLMGWSVVIALKPLIHVVPTGALLWLLAGGLAYSAGVIFFAMPRVRYSHAVWHGFVLAGSIFHYLAILHYVARARV